MYLNIQKILGFQNIINMLSWSFNITFFLLSRKPKCVPYTYSTFQLRLAAFQVFNNHRWLVTSGLHRTTLDALLVHWWRTPVLCSCVWLIGLELPLHLYSSNHSTSQASSPPGSLWGPPRPRELPALSTTSLLLHCLLCTVCTVTSQTCSKARTLSYSPCNA